MTCGEPHGAEHPREADTGFAGRDLGRKLDQVEEERLLRGRRRDRMEMGILYHSMTLNQGIHDIAATQATVSAQPHGMITLLKID